MPHDITPFAAAADLRSSRRVEVTHIREIETELLTSCSVRQG